MHDIALFNLLKIMEVTLAEKEGEFEDFSTILEALKKNIRSYVVQMVDGSNIVEVEHRDFAPTPLLSCFVDNCVEQGVDVNERPLGWREQKKFAGGGALMDLGIHMADLVRFMLGNIHFVRSEFYTYAQERFLNGKDGATGKVDVDEYAKVDIKLQNAGLGTIECSRISSDLHENTVVEIYGTKGSIRINGDEPLYPTIHRHAENRSCSGEVESNNSFQAFCRKIYPTEKTTLGTQVDMHQTSLYNIFLNMVQGQIVYQETSTFYEAAQAQKIIEMAYLSEMESNRWVLWNEVEI